MDSSEKQKIAELIKKSKDGQMSGMMDWMYTREKNNSEDYLLGKKVDKKFETGDQSPPKEDDVFSERIKANIALDMQAKMREDPLYAIKKREEESKKKILHNPVKMKELQKIIAQQKKAKKKKKHKKGSKDDDLIQQYLLILSKKHNKGHSGKHKKHKHSKKSSSESSSSDSDTNKDRRPKKHKPSSKSHKHEDKSDSKRKPDGKHRHDSDSDGRRHRSRSPRHDSRKPAQEYDHRKFNKEHDGPHRNYDRHQREERISDQGRARREHISPDHERSERRQRQERKEPKKRQSSSSEEEVEVPRRAYGLIKPANFRERSRSHSPGGKKSRAKSPNRSSGRRSRSRSPVRATYKRPNKQNREPTPPRRTLTAEEKERRLKEMIENAKWRDTQRKTNVQRYREEDKKDEEKQSVKGSSATFINSMMSEHATNSSVEERIKRNKYNIQRTNAALEKNFTEH